MTAAIPVTRANELFNEFADVVGKSDNLSEFAIARFFREAKAEVGRDPVPAYMLMGALSAYKFDLEDLHRYHKAAIDIDDSELTHRNYAVSLQVVSLIDEAADQAVLSAQRCPEDLASLFSAIEFSWFAGRVEASLKLIDTYTQRGGEKLELLSFVSSAKRVLDQLGISEITYRRSLKISSAILRKRKIRPIRNTVLVDDDGMDSSILVSYLVDLPQHEADSLQGILAESMLESLGDDWQPNALMFEFLPK